MAHFARIENGRVIIVHVLANAVITDDDGVEHEEWGQAFLADLHGGEPAEFVQTSYNGTFRFNYAGIGYTFDPDKGTDGAFIPPKPFESWVLVEETCLWTAPVPMPEETDEEGNPVPYVWDETAGEWVVSE